MYINGLEKANQLLRAIEKTRMENEKAIEEMLNGSNHGEERIIVFYNNPNPNPKIKVSATA